MNLATRSPEFSPAMPGFFSDLFRGDLTDWGLTNFAPTNTTLPSVNVIEDDNAFNVEVAAPGMKRDDFNVSYENGRLTISSEQKEEEKEEESKYSRREFNYQSFQRVFSVPEDIINPDHISAKYNDGILRVELPKSEKAKPKPPKSIKIS